MACDPETCDSATNQLKTGHTETRDQQLAAQSPTTRRRQETREQMPEAGDHAARVQEGAKRQESRRLGYPKAKGGPRFRTGGRKKRRQLIITRRMVIFRFVPTTGPTASMIKKRAGKFDKKVMSKKAFSDS